MEAEVKFIKVACEKVTIVNLHTVMATARGVISHDANLFLENGDYIVASLVNTVMRQSQWP